MRAAMVPTEHHEQSTRPEPLRTTRIGHRIRQGSPVPVTWREMRAGGIRRRQPVDLATEVSDLSVTGAQVRIAAGGSAVVGNVIGIELDGAWGTARIVRVQVDDDGVPTRCGVQFLDVDQFFLDAVTAHQYIEPLVARGIAMHD